MTRKPIVCSDLHGVRRKLPDGSAVCGVCFKRMKQRGEMQDIKFSKLEYAVGTYPILKGIEIPKSNRRGKAKSGKCKISATLRKLEVSDCFCMPAEEASGGAISSAKRIGIKITTRVSSGMLCVWRIE